MDELFLILKLTARERLGGVSENSYNKLFNSIHDFYHKTITFLAVHTYLGQMRKCPLKGKKYV